MRLETELDSGGAVPGTADVPGNASALTTPAIYWREQKNERFNHFHLLRVLGEAAAYD